LNTWSLLVEIWWGKLLVPDLTTPCSRLILSEHSDPDAAKQALLFVSG